MRFLYCSVLRDKDTPELGILFGDSHLPNREAQAGTTCMPEKRVSVQVLV